jgi:hypothetical protein
VLQANLVDPSFWTQVLQVLQDGVGPSGCAIIIGCCGLIWRLEINFRYTLKQKEAEVARAIEDRNDWKHRLFESMGKQTPASSDDPMYAIENLGHVDETELKARSRQPVRK